MTKEIFFECQIECSSLCCGGATIITLDEIGKFYSHFPITIAFQKIIPVDDFHAQYLSDFLRKKDGFFIVGDFVAGNRLKRRCSKLKNSLCQLQNTGKPLQCRVVPFSVTFPEEYQDRVINYRRKGAFRNCKGFSSNSNLLWSGRFEDRELSINFYKLKENMRAQQEILSNILNTLSGSKAYKIFMERETGLLELPIPRDFLILILEKANIEKPQDFLIHQKKLISSELSAGQTRNPLFSEALRELEALAI